MLNGALLRHIIIKATKNVHPSRLLALVFVICSALSTTGVALAGSDGAIDSIERWTDDLGERVFGFEAFCPKDPKAISDACLQIPAATSASNCVAQVEPPLVPGHAESLAWKVAKNVAWVASPIALNGLVVDRWLKNKGLTYEGQNLSPEVRACQAKTEWNWLLESSKKWESLLEYNRTQLGKRQLELSTSQSCSVGGPFRPQHVCALREQTKKNLQIFFTLESRIRNLETAVAMQWASAADKKNLARAQQQRQFLLDSTPLVAHPKMQKYSAQLLSAISQRKSLYDAIDPKEFNQDFDQALLAIDRSIEERLAEAREIHAADRDKDDDKKDTILHRTPLLQELLLTSGGKTEIQNPTLISAACRLETRTYKHQAMGELRGLAVNSALAVMPLGAGMLASSVRGASVAVRVARLAPTLAVDAAGLGVDYALIERKAQECSRLQAQIQFDRPHKNAERENAANKFRDCNDELDSQLTMALLGGAGASVGTIGTVAREVKKVRSVEEVASRLTAAKSRLESIGRKDLIPVLEGLDQRLQQPLSNGKGVVADVIESAHAIGAGKATYEAADIGAKARVLSNSQEFSKLEREAILRSGLAGDPEKFKAGPRTAAAKLSAKEKQSAKAPTPEPAREHAMDENDWSEILEQPAPKNPGAPPRLVIKPPTADEIARLEKNSNPARSLIPAPDWDLISASEKAADPKNNSEGLKAMTQWLEKNMPGVTQFEYLGNSGMRYAFSAVRADGSKMVVKVPRYHVQIRMDSDQLHKGRELERLARERNISSEEATKLFEANPEVIPPPPPAKRLSETTYGEFTSALAGARDTNSREDMLMSAADLYHKLPVAEVQKLPAKLRNLGITASSFIEGPTMADVAAAYRKELGGRAVKYDELPPALKDFVDLERDLKSGEKFEGLRKMSESSKVQITSSAKFEDYVLEGKDVFTPAAIDVNQGANFKTGPSAFARTKSGSLIPESECFGKFLYWVKGTCIDLSKDFIPVLVDP